jgi:cytochrome P450
MDGTKGNADPNAGAVATMEFLTAVRALASERMREPGPDLISAMVTGTSESAGVAAERIGGILIQLAIAGNETTRGASGLGMRVLLEHPDQWAEIVREPELVSPAVEEMLRFRPPVQYLRRTAAQQAPLSAVAGTPTASSGDTVYLSIASANRDPEAFDRPGDFDIHRWPGERSHLSFGVGSHFCLGAALARLELTSLFASVAEHAPGIRQAEPALPGRSNQFIDSLSGLPVTV